MCSSLFVLAEPKIDLAQLFAEAFGFSGDDVLPGLVVDGSAVETGDLRVLPLARAPLTLRSSLASANPTVLIEAPDSYKCNAPKRFSSLRRQVT